MGKRKLRPTKGQEVAYVDNNVNPALGMWFNEGDLTVIEGSTNNGRLLAVHTKESSLAVPSSIYVSAVEMIAAFRPMVYENGKWLRKEWD